MAPPANSSDHAIDERLLGLAGDMIAAGPDRLVIAVPLSGIRIGWHTAC
jgi:hypothetical protein